MKVLKSTEQDEGPSGTGPKKVGGATASADTGGEPGKVGDSGLVAVPTGKKLEKAGVRPGTV